YPGETWIYEQTARIVFCRVCRHLAGRHGGRPEPQRLARPAVRDFGPRHHRQRLRGEGSGRKAAETFGVKGPDPVISAAKIPSLPSPAAAWPPPRTTPAAP